MVNAVLPQDVNLRLGQSAEKGWSEAPESFHEFVRLMHEKSGSRFIRINGHFQQQALACARGFVYEYYLRLEDLAQWLPCFEEGLGLTKFTANGWVDTWHGKVSPAHAQRLLALLSRGIHALPCTHCGLQASGRSSEVLHDSQRNLLTASSGCRGSPNEVTRVALELCQ
jgi:hypothetical protein